MKDNTVFLEELHAFQPAKGHLAFWWLGQMGFAIKISGKLVFIDAFLSPHERRLIPPAVDVNATHSADLVFGTHDHLDHIDRQAWMLIAKASPKTRFVVPEIHRLSVTAQLGVKAHRVVGVDEDLPAVIDDIVVKAIPSAHEFLDTDQNTGLHPHLGYIIESDGLRFYHSGDSCIYEGMHTKLKSHAPFDVMFVPINGRDAVRYRRPLLGNMTAQEAVDLVGPIRPRLAVPGHYEMFAANSGDPGLFADYLDAKYPGIDCWVGEHQERVDV